MHVRIVKRAARSQRLTNTTSNCRSPPGPPCDRREAELTQGGDDVRAESLLLPERLRFDLDIDGTDALAKTGDSFDDLVPRTLDVDPQRERTALRSQHAVEAHACDATDS